MSRPTNDPRILLILDLDETLIHARHKPLAHEADFIVFDYHVYLRPNLQSFIEEVIPHFQLAVWTSASEDYGYEIVKRIFPDHSKLVFFWARNRCLYIPRSTNNDNYSPHEGFAHYEYVKKLNKLKKRGWSLNRILIVDDTPYKCKFNYGNAIYPKPYEGDPSDNELKKLAIYLKQLKDKINVRSVEKRGWQSGIEL